MVLLIQYFSAALGTLSAYLKKYFLSNANITTLTQTTCYITHCKILGNTSYRTDNFIYLFSWKRLLWIKLLVNRWHPRMNQQPTFHHLVLLGEGGRLEFSCFGWIGSGFQPWYINTYNNFNSLNGHVKENYDKIRYRNKIW